MSVCNLLQWLVVDIPTSSPRRFPFLSSSEFQLFNVLGLFSSVVLLSVLISKWVR
ncbi:hypothetical protein K402DRAFT_389363 [Aulographum hederae CBS 113979]|uniref:Uncharacterized protein n=1 Tax=Aulographum hederae CBS 113979 TaxID=1176131 RepID=A0A6G1HDM4_9PEZI|nr:hypothetical protein K402DRAFT_389363 [Aulographum hederae CBS 113979]